jgi:alcohol dehydrogenase YqhD (iron-dependent ADH family)
MGILMPVLWEYNCQERPEKFAQMAENVFRIAGAGLSTAELGRRGIEAFTSWLKANGLYYRLRGVNIDDRHFENVAKDAVRIYESIGGAGGSLLNSRRLGVREIVEILRRAL